MEYKLSVLRYGYPDENMELFIGEPAAESEEQILQRMFQKVCDELKSGGVNEYIIECKTMEGWLTLFRKKYT